MKYHINEKTHRERAIGHSVKQEKSNWETKCHESVSSNHKSVR